MGETRASPPRCTCRRVTGRAGSSPRTEFNTLPLINDDDRIVAEYRVRTTDFGVDLGRELGNYGEIRVGAGRSVGSAGVRVGDPLLPPSEFDTHKLFAEFRYDSVDDEEFSAAWRHLHAGLAG